MNKLFGIALLVTLYVSVSDAVISAWTTPSIAGATGSAEASGSIAEDLTAGTDTTISLAVTSTGTATFTMVNGTYGDATFTINSANGKLTLSTGSLDFETYPKPVITVKAVDDATPPATGSATVTLVVTNINEAPVFADTTSGLMVTDGAAAATTVTTITATDPEGTTVVGYKFKSGNTNTDFAIAATTGIITVNTGKTLSKSTTSGYVLVVEGNDGTLTGSTTIAVYVGTACSSGVATLTVAMVTVLLGTLVASLK